jgi:hypothetical protein
MRITTGSSSSHVLVDLLGCIIQIDWEKKSSCTQTRPLASN